MALQSVKLKNGKVVEKNTAIAINMSIKDLFKKDPIACYELNELAKNPDHRVFGSKLQVLKEFGFIRDGIIYHEDIRDIILSAHEGEGMKTLLVHPVEGM